MVLSHCAFKPQIATLNSHLKDPAVQFLGAPDKSRFEDLFPNGLLDPLPQQAQGQMNCVILATLLSALNNPWARTQVLPEIFNSPTGSIRLYNPDNYQETTPQRESIPVSDEDIREVEKTVHGPLGWKKLMAGIAKMRMKTEPGKFQDLAKALQEFPVDKIYFMLFGQAPSYQHMDTYHEFRDYFSVMSKALDEIAVDFDNYILTIGLPSRPRMGHHYAVVRIDSNAKTLTLQDPYQPLGTKIISYKDFIAGKGTLLSFIQIQPKPCKMMKFKYPSMPMSCVSDAKARQAFWLYVSQLSLEECV